MSLELNILTLNVWGIPFVSRDRGARIASISAELNTGHYDIVSLQEVWSQKDCQALKEKTEAFLPYSHYFYSGVIGAGLLVLSKYPIIGTLFHAWCVNGYFHRIQHADWFGGKGVGLCRILIGDRVVHLYNAHLHAEYDSENDEYKTHRVIQAFDTAQFIRATRGGSALQILAGDLNTQPQDLTYKVLLYLSKMRDCCTSDLIVTNECQRNSYTSKRALSKNSHGIRIDHIFVRNPDNVDVSVMECTLPFPERVPGHKFSYSDHEAVLVKLKLSVSQKTLISGKEVSYPATTVKRYMTGNISLDGAGDSQCDHKGDDPIANRIAVLNESIALCDGSLQQLKIDRILYYSIAIFFTFVLIAFVEYSVPSGFKPLYLLLKFIIFGVIFFCAFMGSLWNYMEHNGVLSSKSSMEMMIRCTETFELGLN